MPFPLPGPERDGHYMTYAAMKNAGKLQDLPLEEYPSKSEAANLRQTAAEHPSCPASTLTAQNVRKTVQCSDCSKPRCIYADHALTPSEGRELRNILRKYGDSYVCGCVIVPDESELRVYTRLALSCHTPMEKMYYGSDKV